MTELTGGQKPVQTLRSMLSRGHLRMVLLAVFLASVSLMVSGIYAIRGYAVENVSLSARSLAYTVEPALVFGDRQAAQTLIDHLGKTDNLALIEVRDREGQVFARWQRPGAHQFEAKTALSRALWLGPVTQDITFRGEPIGSVTVTGALKTMLSYAMSALIIALCCLGITVLATRILARRLEESIAAPLERVALIAHEVRNDRRFSRRMEQSGVAEIDKFALDFNALLGELETWYDGLTSENALLAVRADHDPLTGLGNRARFERMLEGAIKVGEMSGRQVALLYFDCNDFKAINDSHGHEAGDAVIRTIAERLRRSVREKDRVFRLGGDEFAIVLDNLTSLEAVERVNERVRSIMSEPINVALQVERVLKLSIGVACFPADGDSLRALVRVADQRMYREKRGARSDARQDT